MQIVMAKNDFCSTLLGDEHTLHHPPQHVLDQEPDPPAIGLVLTLHNHCLLHVIAVSGDNEEKVESHTQLLWRREVVRVVVDELGQHHPDTKFATDDQRRWAAEGWEVRWLLAHETLQVSG